MLQMYFIIVEKLKNTEVPSSDYIPNEIHFPVSVCRTPCIGQSCPVLVLPSVILKTRVILPGEKACRRNVYKLQKLYMSLTLTDMSHKLEKLGACEPPVAVAKWSKCLAASLKVPSSILVQDYWAMFFILFYVV